MDADKAIQLIEDLIAAENEINRTQNRRGLPTKGSVAAEQRAAQAIFIALVGRKATAEELKKATEL